MCYIRYLHGRNVISNTHATEFCVRFFASQVHARLVVSYMLVLSVFSSALTLPPNMQTWTTQSVALPKFSLTSQVLHAPLLA